MAAAFLNNICPDYFEARSAGLDAGVINLRVQDRVVCFVRRFIQG